MAISDFIRLRKLGIYKYDRYGLVLILFNSNLEKFCEKGILSVIYHKLVATIPTNQWCEKLYNRKFLG